MLWKDVSGLEYQKRGEVIMQVVNTGNKNPHNNNFLKIYDERPRHKKTIPLSYPVL
jgi:hypothetical protein